jgi:hypothetical protein
LSEVEVRALQMMRDEPHSPFRDPDLHRSIALRAGEVDLLRVWVGTLPRGTQGLNRLVLAGGQFHLPFRLRHLDPMAAVRAVRLLADHLDGGSYLLVAKRAGESST